MSFYSCQGKFAHRIILGEIRGQEAFDLLQLLNTGHAGTLSTIHANSAKQGLARFTSYVLQSGVELPYRAIKTNIGDSLEVVVHIERRPGRRGPDSREGKVHFGRSGYGGFDSKSVDRLSSFQDLASSRRARSFFSAPLYASLPSNSRYGGLCSCVSRTIACAAFFGSPGCLPL